MEHFDGMLKRIYNIHERWQQLTPKYYLPGKKEADSLLHGTNISLTEDKRFKGSGLVRTGPQETEVDKLLKVITPKQTEEILISLACNIVNYGKQL